MMKRLKYVSRFAEPMTSKEIWKLTARASKKNQEMDVTGVLMTSGGVFFQVIEGPAENIDQLYSAIVQDKRHVDVLLLGVEENVETRLYPDWSMQRIDLDESANIRTEPIKTLLNVILQQRKSLEEMTATLERSVWHELQNLTTKPAPEE